MSDDRGSIAPAVPLLLVALLLLGGLVIDGSRQLIARGEAQAYAEEAARAGASAIDKTSITLSLVPDRAVQLVRDYCDAVERENAAVEQCGVENPAITEVGPGDDRRIVVHTHVRLRLTTTLLQMAGFSTLRATGAAKARPYEGLTGAGAR